MKQLIAPVINTCYKHQLQAVANNLSLSFSLVNSNSTLLVTRGLWKTEVAA